MKRMLLAWMSSTLKETAVPYMTLPTSSEVIYSHDKSDCSLQCSDLLSYMKLPTAIGFDVEWRPIRRKDVQQKVAVIQICTLPLWKCYVFHISKMGCVPETLQNVIENVNIKKVGIGVGEDLWKLHRDYDIDYKKTQGSYIDLNQFARSINIYRSQPNWSVNAWCKILFQKTVKKGKLQMSDWEAFPLTNEQISYAALDAYVSLLIYTTLQQRIKQKK